MAIALANYKFIFNDIGKISDGVVVENTKKFF